MQAARRGRCRRRSGAAAASSCCCCRCPGRSQPVQDANNDLGDRSRCADTRSARWPATRVTQTPRCRAGAWPLHPAAAPSPMRSLPARQPPRAPAAPATPRLRPWPLLASDRKCTRGQSKASSCSYVTVNAGRPLSTESNRMRARTGADKLPNLPRAHVVGSRSAVISPHAALCSDQLAPTAPPT